MSGVFRRVVVEGGVEFPLRAGDDTGDRGVAGDIDRCAGHVEKSVDAENEGDALHRQSHLGENHAQHDKTHPRHAGCSYRGEGRGENDHEELGRAEFEAVGLGDEYRGDSLHDGGAIHIDGRAERHGERGDRIRDAQAEFNGVECNGDGCVARSGRKGKEVDLPHLAEKRPDWEAGEYFQKERIDAETVQGEGEEDCEKIPDQRPERSESLVGKSAGDEGEDTDWSKRHDDADEFHDDVVPVIAGSQHTLARSSGEGEGQSKQDGKDNDLKHVPRCHGFEGVFGNEVHKRVSQRRGLAGLEVGACIEGETAPRAEQESQAHGHGNRSGGGNQIKGKRTEAHSPEFADVIHRRRSADQREKDNWNHENRE
jgi:hypothetical protein